MRKNNKRKNADESIGVMEICGFLLAVLVGIYGFVCRDNPLMWMLGIC